MKIYYYGRIEREESMKEQLSRFAGYSLVALLIAGLVTGIFAFTGLSANILLGIASITWLGAFAALAADGSEDEIVLVEEDVEVE